MKVQRRLNPFTVCENFHKPFHIRLQGFMEGYMKIKYPLINP